jgi:hypothetical protein
LITFKCLWSTEEFSYAATHGDASTAKLMAHGAPGNAYLGTDLAEAPTLGVQVGCALNIHRATVTAARPCETKTPLQMNDYLLEGGNADDRAEAVVSRLACSGVAQALCCRIGPAWAKGG